MDKYQYYFSSRDQFARTGKPFNKIYVNEFLFEVDAAGINKLNKVYGVPEITKERIINFNEFINLPLYDLIACLILFRIIKYIFNL